jgi:hypothetical protein
MGSQRNGSIREETNMMMDKKSKDTHTMPDGTVMKGAKHGYSYGGMAKKKKPMGYAHGGLACGASNPAARPMKNNKS